MSRTSGKGEYGIAANVIEVDRVFRLGAKVIMQGHGDDERFSWRGLSRSGKPITKFTPLHRLSYFRSKWLTEAQRKHVWYLGTREEMEKWAKELSDRAIELRRLHPNRRETVRDGAEHVQADVLRGSAAPNP